jgi:molybdopterin synthase sulfur carrier subunit
MAHVTFTQNIQRHIACPPCQALGATVGEVLERVFAGNPRARDYVLDDQGAVRRHMVVFVDGRQIRDRARLSDPVPPDAEVCVMQALSGG